MTAARWTRTCSGAGWRATNSSRSGSGYSMSSSDRVALVTGTNRGSGLAIAEDLCDRGYRVYSLNRTLLGKGWLGEIQCDLADPAAIRAAVSQVIGQAGHLDACVSNSVDRVLDPLADLREADWDRLLAVNLSATYHLIRATLAALRERQGIFVAMGSHAATRFFEGGAAYSATKAGLKALVETLLLEERPNGVRACLVSPGAIANLPGDDDPNKLTTAAIGACVGTIIDTWGAELVVGEIEVRPATLPKPPIVGIDRLLHV
ncbi:SDR family NAD(P)-dependent oxidoreductase [Actinokineospora sp. HUAS TT18]|uniref:SDR family NAD(P)-dependent oxidoreductase n=1 Tax=Actinokineospora sp. HUAS TT18 TaxID=3447451 RepID=UPI003F51C313